MPRFPLLHGPPQPSGRPWDRLLSPPASSQHSAPDLCWLPGTHKQQKQPISALTFKPKTSPSLLAHSLLSCCCCRLCSMPELIALDKAQYKFSGLQVPWAEYRGHFPGLSTVFLLCNSHIHIGYNFPNSSLVPDSRVLCGGVFRA